MRTPHLVALLLATGLAVPAAADAAVLPGASVDGPSADIKEFGNVDIASDGTGAIAYIKAEGGKNRVFVARVANGVIGAPERADVGVDAIESRPRVAAAPGGKLIVSYLRDDGGGNKVGYSITQGTGQAWTSNNLANAVGPYVSNDIDISANGIAYNVNSTNNDVFAFRFDGTNWTPVNAGAALDQTGGNAAGGSMEQNQPRIAVTPDGNGVIAWPEGAVNAQDKVWARRITGTTTGAAVEASLPTLDGAPTANFAFMVDVDTDGAGNAYVAFRNDFTYGATNRARLLVRKFTGETFGPASVVDGHPNPPTEGAENPRVDVNATGQGLVGAPRQLSGESYFSTLTGDAWAAGARVDTTPSTANSRTTAAIGDNGGGLIAWVQKPAAGDTELLGRRYDNGALGAQFTISAPGLGTVDAGVAPEIAADANGNVLVGYAQGPAGNLRISAAIVDAPAPPTGGGGGGGGQPGGGGTGGGGGVENPPADTVAPLLTKLKLSPTKFKVGSKQPSIKTAAKAKTGTTISFTLNEAATVTYTVERKTVTKKRKVKFVRAQAWSQNAAAGASKVRYEGIVKKRKLGVGTYRITIVATDAKGNKAKAQVKTFKVVRR